MEKKGKMNQNHITEQEMVDILKDQIWQVSHGGVSSTYIRNKVLRLMHPDKFIVRNRENQPFGKVYGNGGRLVHYPFPVSTGPKLCIYVFGDVLNSLISQLHRHPENAAFLHNDKGYIFAGYEALAKTEDAFGIRYQIESFHTIETDYPIILLNYSKLHYSHFIEISKRFEFVEIYDQYRKRPRNSRLESLSENQKRLLVKAYGDFSNEVESYPAMRIRYPDIETSDVVIH
jgi:hypothetical protein